VPPRLHECNRGDELETAAEEADETKLATSCLQFPIFLSNMLLVVAETLLSLMFVIAVVVCLSCPETFLSLMFVFLDGLCCFCSVSLTAK
jgi:hypothetical protein